MWKVINILHLWHFHFDHFVHFGDLWFVINWLNAGNHIFCNGAVLIGLRPYYVTQERRVYYVWWFSLSYQVIIWWCIFLWLMSWRFTGEEKLIYTLVLPSLICVSVLFFCLVWLFMSGRLHRRGGIIYIRSPLSDTFRVPFDYIHVGEITQEMENYFNSRSPLYEPIFVCFWGPHFSHIFWSILMTPILSWPTDCGVLSQWPRAHILYIYSLGHFLTTKGALIDGDQGGSKNDQFWSKWPKNKWKNQ